MGVMMRRHARKQLPRAVLDMLPVKVVDLDGMEHMKWGIVRSSGSSGDEVSSTQTNEFSPLPPLARS